MPDALTLAAFAMVALAMVLSPGPNMIYLISRSIAQGRAAGLWSLLGVAAGFLVYMLCAALGLTAFIFAIPLAYDALRLAGAGYLAWLAWQAFTGRASPFAARSLPTHGRGRLIAMGFLTNILNPKIAMMYLALLPQFLDPARGNILGQAVVLGALQIAISVCVNALIVLSAARVAVFLASRPSFVRAQQWIMGTVLAALAIRMATDSRR